MDAKLKRWDPSEYIESEEDAIVYLNAAAESDDLALLQAAIGHIAKARGMGQIAKEAGVGRESLYKSLDATGNPSFKTITKVVHALGGRLTITTAQEHLELKGATAADHTDPVVRDEIAEWAHDTVKVNGNHMLTIDLFHQAERKNPRWSPAKVRRSFQAAGIGQGRTPEKRSRSMVYLTDPEEYSGTERDRLDNGETPEQIAKDWARANGR